MNILQICKKFPYPAKDGETIAILTMSKAFRQLGHSVTILSINTPRHHFDAEKLPEEVKDIAEFQSVDVDTRVRPMAAFMNLFSDKSYNIERFYSQSFTGAIKNLLEDRIFDIIQLEGLFLTPYIPVIRQFSKAPVVLRSHNVEHEIWERMYEQKNGLKKFYLKILAKRLKKFEKDHLNDYDAVIPISGNDELKFKMLGAQKPMLTIEAGLDLDHYKVNKSKENYYSVFFIGGLDWMPNQEGLYWFLEKVWPQVQKQLPDLKFFIAGRNAPARLRDIRQKNVEFIGEVENAIDFFNAKGIMVTPLLSGSGIKVKVLEALVMKKPVVATNIAVEGIPVIHNEHLLIADKPLEFADAVIKIVRDKALGYSLAENGHTMVSQNFSHIALAEKLIDFYKMKLL